MNKNLKFGTKYFQKNITFKKPHDLFIYNNNFYAILHQLISISNTLFLLIILFINLIKNPKIKNYPTTNLYELIDKRINKKNFENNLKEAFEKNLSKMYKIDYKVNSI